MKKPTPRIPAHMPSQILGKSSPRTYYLLSACLAGIKCRYNGLAKPNKNLLSLLKAKPLLVVCPERLGGLPIPHPAGQIVPNNLLSRRACDGNDVWKNLARVITGNGKDLTGFFKAGTRQVAHLIRPLKIKVAYLKSKSPSCGCGQVYNRHPLTKEPKLVNGAGVLTALLKKTGIRTVSID